MDFEKKRGISQNGEVKVSHLINQINEQAYFAQISK
jgi:hypothetical protein